MDWCRPEITVFRVTGVDERTTLVGAPPRSVHETVPEI